MKKVIWGMLATVVCCVIFWGAGEGTGEHVWAAEEVLDEDIKKSVGELEIPEGTTVNGNVSVDTGSLEINGVVNGDVKAALGSVTVNGEVNGNLGAEMGSVDIAGEVSGDVNSRMGSLVVDGSVGGHAKNSLGSIEINGAVGGNVDGGLGEIIINGEVGGDVASKGKNVFIEGAVEGDINLSQGIVELKPGAVVGGTIRIDEGLVKEGAESQAGGIEIGQELTEEEVDELFQTAGGITFTGIGDFLEVFDNGEFLKEVELHWEDVMRWGLIGYTGRALQRLSSMIILFALSALIYTLFPKQVKNIGETITKQASSAVMFGILALVLALPVMFLLLITIIGIPLILVVILALAVAWILGYAGIVALIGGRVLEAAKVENENPILNILVGVVLLGMISFVPILGFLVSLAVAIVAVGSALSSRFGTVSVWEN